MRFDDIVPVNDFIDGTELRNSAFDLPEEPFDFSIRLRMFYTGRDVFDVVKSEEFFELMVSVFTVPSRNELSTIISQDLAGGVPYSRNPWFRTVMVLSVVGESKTP